MGNRLTATTSPGHARRSAGEGIWSLDKPAWHRRALAKLFGAVAALRRKLFAAGWLKVTRLDVPVIVVGNLTAGGSGKTPLVIALVEFLRKDGWSPGVISRGYGRRTRGLMTVTTNSVASDVGDEPLLIARTCKVPVAVAERRVDAATALRSAHECDVLIADDGLQHYAMARDVEILVVDGQRGFGNGYLLPAGPLREPVARGDLCDLRVVNGAGAGSVGSGYLMQLKPADPVSMADGSRHAWREFDGKAVHGVAGIGNPERFFVQLEAAGLTVIRHPFPDHHQFALSDLVFGDELPILMTAKDAIKCQGFVLPMAFRVDVSAELDSSFYSALLALLPTVVKEESST